MNRNRYLIVPTLACLMSGHVTHADPIHAIADGAYWHHDSGWVFPEKLGQFARIGAAQDVAGSSEAVAHYAAVENGLRTTASVDIYPADSALAGTDLETAGRLMSEGEFAVGKAHALSAVRRIYAVGQGESTGLIAIYLVIAGEWRVTIRIDGSHVDAVPMMDAFVLAQRWETLSGH
jgi:hypothetical protein